MATVLLVVHIMVAFSMIVLILLQRSEGGALGMGGGGGGFVTGRGAANLLTRMTAILAAIFFTTSLALGVIGHRPAPTSAVGVPAPGESQTAPAGEQTPPTLPSVSLKKLKQEQPAGSTAPAPAAPTTPAPAPAPAQPRLPQSQ
jgi:preprotein translocase subunit SecG